MQAQGIGNSDGTFYHICPHPFRHEDAPEKNKQMAVGCEVVS